MFVKFHSHVWTTTRVAIKYLYLHYHCSMPKFLQSRCSRPIFPSAPVKLPLFFNLEDVTIPHYWPSCLQIELVESIAGPRGHRLWFRLSVSTPSPLSRRSYPPSTWESMRYLQFSQVFGRRRCENFIFRWLVASFSRVVLSAFPSPASSSCTTLCRPSNSLQQLVQQTELKIPLLRSVAAIFSITIRFSPQQTQTRKSRKVDFFFFFLYYYIIKRWTRVVGFLVKLKTRTSR